MKQGADRIQVAEVCRRAGISQATYVNWKKKRGGLRPIRMNRLKQVEDDSTLRTLVADLSLDKEMLRDVIRQKRNESRIRPGLKSTMDERSGACHGP